MRERRVIDIDASMATSEDLIEVTFEDKQPVYVSIKSGVYSIVNEFASAEIWQTAVKLYTSFFPRWLAIPMTVGDIKRYNRVSMTVLNTGTRMLQPGEKFTVTYLYPLSGKKVREDYGVIKVIRATTYDEVRNSRMH